MRLFVDDEPASRKNTRGGVVNCTAGRRNLQRKARVAGLENDVAAEHDVETARGHAKLRRTETPRVRRPDLGYRHRHRRRHESARRRRRKGDAIQVEGRETLTLTSAPVVTMDIVPVAPSALPHGLSCSPAGLLGSVPSVISKCSVARVRFCRAPRRRECCDSLAGCLRSRAAHTASGRRPWP